MVQAAGIQQFNFIEWWKFEGETMKEPFDVHEEVVVGLLCALKMVCTLFHLLILKLTSTVAGS